MTTKQNKGFTLLEILLVIAVIGILAAIVLVAINPNRQIAQVRDAQRRSDINTIYKALEQYLIDTGSYPNSVNSNFKEICKTGNKTTTDTLNPTTLCDNKADLRVLVPTYLAAMPTDPSGGEYRVGINSNNKIAVYTVGENNQLIDINFNDIDANNYIAAVELADGQTLELEVKIAITIFIIGLKSDNIWEPIKASVIMSGARTLNGSLVPLKGAAPTNFNFVAGDYDRKTGLVGDGATKYLNSNRKNNEDPAQSKHICVYMTLHHDRNTTRGAIATDTYNTGLPDPGAGAQLITTTTLRTYRINAGYLSGNDTLIPDTATAPGFWGASRNSFSFVQGRYQGTTVDYPLNAAGTLLAEDIKVFTRNQNYSNGRLAFYSIGESLDLALLDARVSQLMTDYANAIP